MPDYDSYDATDPFISLGGEVDFTTGLRPAQSPQLSTVRRKGRLREQQAPAHTILGRRAFEGLLIYECQNQGKLNLLLLVSNGACSGISGIIIEGELHAMARDTDYAGLEPAYRVISGKYYGTRTKPLVRAIPYFEDTPGKRVPTLEQEYRQGFTWAHRVNRQNADDETFTPIPIPDPWTSQHRVTGKSVVHLILDTDTRSTWQERPDDLRLVIDGLTYSVPSTNWRLDPIRRDQLGIEDVEFTQSAARAAFLWYTRFRKLNPRRLDPEAFAAADRLCSQRLTYDFGNESSVSNYSRHSMRYSVNGIISSDDDPEEVERQLHMAMAGRLVYEDGVYRILPGQHVEPKWILGPKDLVGEFKIQDGKVNSQNITGVKCTLASSKEHGYEALDLDPVHFFGEEGETGEILDLGTLAFVNDPLQALRLMWKALLRVREQKRGTGLFLPGDDGQHWNIRVGDGVQVLAPGVDPDRTTFVVDKTELDGSLNVRLSMTKQFDQSDGHGPLPRKGANIGPQGGPTAPPPQPDPSELYV